MQGLNFLVGNQLDLAIEELGQAARLAPDALEIHMILGNLYREKGQVGRAVQIHQQLLQRPAPRAPRAHLRAALPRPRLPPRRLRRSRDRSVHRSPAPRSEERARAAAARAALRGSASVGRGGGDPRAARADRAARACRRGITRSRRSSRTSSACRRARRATTRARPGISRRRSISIRASRPPISTSAICASSRATRPAAVGRSGGDWPASRRSARIWSSIGSVSGYDALGDADQLRRALPVADRGRRRRTGGRASRSACISGERGDARGALDLLLEALAHNPHAVNIHQAIWETLTALQLPRRRHGSLHGRQPRRRCSTATRTSACAAAIAATSCSGSARTATNGIPSSRSAWPPRRMANAPRVSDLCGSRASFSDPQEPANPDRHWTEHSCSRSPSRAASPRARPTYATSSNLWAFPPSTPTCWPVMRCVPPRPRSSPSSTASGVRFSRPTARSIGRRSPRIVFADEQARKDLEGIIHPAVYTAIAAWFVRLAAKGAPPIAIADIPLLYETNNAGAFDRVVVSSCT